MKLLLIRHAESVNQVLERTPHYNEQRLPDPPLSDLGRQQAEALAKWAASEPIFGEVTHLYSSLMTRAIQTAAPLAKALELDIHGLANAYEWGRGQCWPSRKLCGGGGA